MAERTILRCLSEVSANVVAEHSEMIATSPTQATELSGTTDPLLKRSPIEETSLNLEEKGVPHLWWKAAEQIAVLVVIEGLGIENDQALRKELSNQGYAKETIEQALDWLMSVILSGQSNATLSMLLPVENSIRIEHPLEQVSVPVSLQKNLLKCIRKGLITRDYGEKILEGFRNIEARDWGQREVLIFLFDALSPSLPWLTPEILKEVLCGTSKEELFH